MSNILMYGTVSITGGALNVLDKKVDKKDCAH